MKENMFWGKKARAYYPKMTKGTLSAFSNRVFPTPEMATQHGLAEDWGPAGGGELGISQMFITGLDSQLVELFAHEGLPLSFVVPWALNELSLVEEVPIEFLR